MHSVVLYTKSGCCLCDGAKDALALARRRVEFALHEVDIESEPAIFARHRYDIPVIEVDGRRAFKHRVTADELVQRLTR